MLSATKVYNGLLWNLRQEYETTGKSSVSRKNLNRILKTLPRASKLRRGLYEAVGLLMVRPEDERQIAVVPYTNTTLQLAQNIINRTNKIGIRNSAC